MNKIRLADHQCKTRIFVYADLTNEELNSIKQLDSDIYISLLNKDRYLIDFKRASVILVALTLINNDSIK